VSIFLSTTITKSFFFFILCDAHDDVANQSVLWTRSKFCCPRVLTDYFFLKKKRASVFNLTFSMDLFFFVDRKMLFFFNADYFSSLNAQHE